MPNSTSTIAMDRSHPISTSTGGSKTNAFADGMAPLVTQVSTEASSMFKSTIERNPEASTSNKSFVNRAL